MNRIQFGQKAQKQIERLSRDIENLYLVGGIVRDYYLYGTHHTDDIDLTTDLPVEAIRDRVKTGYFQPNETFTVCINADDSVIEITPSTPCASFASSAFNPSSLNTSILPMNPMQNWIKKGRVGFIAESKKNNRQTYLP